MKKVSFILGLALPSIAFAQTTAITDANSLTRRLVSIGDTVIYLLIALAVIYIVWNVVQYFIKGSDEEGARKKSGANIFWGIVGLAVILSIWGLVNILTSTFRTTPATNPIPNLGSNSNAGGIPGNQVPVIQ